MADEAANAHIEGPSSLKSSGCELVSPTQTPSTSQQSKPKYASPNLRKHLSPEKSLERQTVDEKNDKGGHQLRFLKKDKEEDGKSNEKVADNGEEKAVEVEDAKNSENLNAPSRYQEKRMAYLVAEFPREIEDDLNEGTVLWIAGYNNRSRTFIGYFVGADGERIEDDLSDKLARTVSWMIQLYLDGVTWEKYKPLKDEVVNIGEPGKDEKFVAEIIADRPAHGSYAQAFFCRYRGETLGTAEWLTIYEFSKTSTIVSKYNKIKKRKAKFDSVLPITRKVFGAITKNSAKSAQLKSQCCKIPLPTSSKMLLPVPSSEKSEGNQSANQMKKVGAPRYHETEHYKNRKRHYQKIKRSFGFRRRCIMNAINSQVVKGKITCRQGDELTKSSLVWEEFVKKLDEILTQNNIGKLDVLEYAKVEGSSKIGTLRHWLSKACMKLRIGVWFLAIKTVEKEIGHCGAINNGKLCFDEMSALDSIMDDEIQEIGVFTIIGAKFKKIKEGDYVRKACGLPSITLNE